MPSFSGNCSIIGIPGQKSSINWNAKNETILNIRKHLENHPILTEEKDTPHSHLTLRAASDILASAKEALDWAKKCVEEVSFNFCFFSKMIWFDWLYLTTIYFITIFKNLPRW